MSSFALFAGREIMTSGETLYLVLVIAAFAGFGVVLAYATLLGSRESQKASAPGAQAGAGSRDQRAA